MRSKMVIAIIVCVIAVFLHFNNGNKIVRYTKQYSMMEKSFAAEKNINTEQLVELDDMKSGRHIASLVRVEMSNFVADKPAGSVIYVHEPSPKSEKGSYCIIDLIASKAEAKTIEVILD
ncbi:MAG TPA: hypothetical protein PL124_05595 [Candidatus Cloacimonadota bacterium]|nr:hypothetical protein [Candidatus Cloacimonadota bacterium]HPS38870.1 hypothetical protein [Candidatus Cloacimonadota bacterium]